MLPLPPWPNPISQPKNPAPVRSYARANQELTAAFDRYLLARGFALLTRKSYGESLQVFVESLGSRSVAEAGRSVIREFLAKLCGRGLGPHTIRRHTASLRSFFRFLQLTGLTEHDPTLMLAHRKLPGRIQRVLTIAEVESLIAASKSPLETAVAEFLYASGVRISELVAMRLEDVDFAAGVALVKKGKGGKDRIVLFGSKADAALRRMIGRRSQRKVRATVISTRVDLLVKNGTCQWRCGPDWTLDRKDLKKRLLQRSDTPAPESKTGFLFGRSEARPYTDTHVRRTINRMGVRAGIGRVYPHALRRAFASHMLQNGADLRAIQELLGHEKVSTTALYASLSIENLKEIHTRCHPTAEGSEHVQEK